ncbi:M50 family metallopeptidase [Aquimarina sediminis]|uniref:M50 family metallopeptidase n=1 Tax=Aquimarina sediminis TaxID=2070536 RepID=UPI000CA08A81|nr:M50 family metallopeptidase [Aquimarina sediminis]
MRNRYKYTIFIVAIVVFVLWQLPYFGWIQFPFILLGTWFHEMGHGLTAILVGGSFKYLEIYENGGGVAYYTITNGYMPLSIANALVAAGGLLGPAITGAMLIISGKSHKSARIALRVLIGVIILSLILWIRSFWGIAVLISFVIFLIAITLFKNQKLEVVTILFLGLQSVLSTYLQLDYLFTKEFERDGAIQISDTQAIAENTIGTYWIWAILIVLISVYLLWKSFQFYFKK